MGRSSSSLSVTETVNGWHDFKIMGYSLSKGIGIGKYIASETFSVGGYSWAIYFYPDGKSSEDNGHYVSLFIALASEGTDVRALFELTLMDQSGNERHKVHTHFGRPLETGPYTLKYRGSMWGYKRFFRRTTLETSDYLKDDCLQVHCCVGVVKSHTEGPKIYSIPEPMSDMGQHFGQLLESGKGTDVNFEVNGETFAAHKLVLAARSPVFRAQLFGPMKDQNTELIKVEEMEAPVFKALLHFMYWDSIPDFEELLGLNSHWASTLMFQHLLAAADQYGLDRLRLLCEASLCDGVAINTVATTLALAEHHQCFQLKSVCLKFVAMPENLRAVMQSDGFDYLRESCPSVLTELLEYVARVTEHSVSINRIGNDGILDGSDVHGRRIYVFRVAINCCTSCPEKLKTGLLRIEGIESVDVDPEKRIVRVKSYIDSKKIIKRIEGMGKSAQLLPEKTEENRPHAYKVVEIHDEEEKVREGSFFGSCLRKGSSKDSSRRRRKARSSHAPEKYEGERNVSSPKEFPEHICRDKYCTFHKRDSTLLSDRVPYMDYQPMFYGGATHSYPIRNTYVPPPPPPYRQYGTEPPPQYRQYGQRMVPPVVGYGGGNQMPRPRSWFCSL